MEKLEKVFLILGIIMLVYLIVFLFGVLSRMSTDGFSFDILINIFPVNKLVMVIISFSGYFILRFTNSKNKKTK